MEAEQPCAPKVLAQHLTSAKPVEGGFQLGGLPVFDRVWVQGTVSQTCAGAVTLDDGTGQVDLSLGLSRANPGLEIDDVRLGSYVLAIGKLVARKQGGGTHLNIRPQKLLHLSCDPDAAAQRMMHWSTEVLELHRVLEAAAPAAAAAAAAEVAAPAAAAEVAAS